MKLALNQGFPYRSVPPVSGGTYQSARLPVRGPPATGRYRQNRPSVVDFGHHRSIEGEKGQKKKKRKRRKKKEEKKKKEYLAPSSPARRSRPRPIAALARDFSPKWGERSRRHRYADRSLLGGTIDWGCFRHVTT
ncbi:hypothetical protein GW17_00008366 [Ensete ventricosum]|nr:hypothetical protein GW17_00008366 [Ensete ventricosum]RZR94473.1 hypothetical protein BHM03_00023188 [Ensete ventricosum]